MYRNASQTPDVPAIPPALLWQWHYTSTFRFAVLPILQGFTADFYAHSSLSQTA